MKVGDMIRNRNHVGLLVSVDRRHGVDCNRHSRIATVMTTEGKLVTWPFKSRYKFEVVT